MKRSLVSASSLKGLFCAVALAVLVIWPSLSIRESLWIDELHSVWTISGTWSEVGSRAAAGNQSPLYFYALKVWSGTADLIPIAQASAETKLRLSSLLGWFVLCALIFKSICRPAQDSKAWIIVAVVTLWLWIDRIGAFYAIELRPYMWVAAVGLLVMLAAARLAQQPDRSGHVWWILAAVVFYLHYTSIIVVLFSWIGCLAAIAWQWKAFDDQQRFRIIRWRSIDLFALALLALPGLYQLGSILNKAQQWASFAGDPAFVKLVDALPWLFWTIIPMLAYTFDRRTQATQTTPATAFDSLAGMAWWLQLCAVGYGSLTLVWLLTYLEIAPLLHRRYVFGAYPALALLGAFWLQRIQGRRLRIATGLASALLLAGWQGTLGEWQAGRFVPWQRQEDWRGAIAYLDQHRQINQPILLAPMLIETNSLLLDPTNAASYLQFPLTSLYPVPDLNSIRVLPNPRSTWISAAFHACTLHSEDTAWIVARIDDAALATDADNPSQRSPREEQPFRMHRVFDGGRVQILKYQKR